MGGMAFMSVPWDSTGLWRLWEFGRSSTPSPPSPHGSHMAPTPAGPKRGAFPWEALASQPGPGANDCAHHRAGRTKRPEIS